MKIKNISFLFIGLLFLLSSCNEFLDRPPLTVANDETVWKNEDNLRLYANKYYTSLFVGYGQGWSNSNSPLMGFRFNDDIVRFGNQGNFLREVPNSRIWSMSQIRSINIMISRIEERMKDILNKEAYNHWLGIGKFLRAARYASLVTAYGDVPYYSHVVSDTDLKDLYKPRTPRNEVMDAVYEDLKFAMENVRLNDGDQFINRYIVAAFASRIALYEGTWQKYYYKNNERAKKFFNIAVESVDMVMNSGKYDIVTDFRKLFTSESLKGNRDCIIYRHYDASVGITHSVASNNNLSETVAFGPTSDFIKSFICIDGKVWQNTELENADNFETAKLISTRDSRFEASFYDKPTPKNKSSYLYINKFLPRKIAKIVEGGGSPPQDYQSTNNKTDYPVFRYAEALLNWIEAKAELQSIGEGSVSQSDIDASINKIRNRPLASSAVEMGVKKTAPLMLSSLPNDPNRDADVSALIWEIRRERRMELAFEHSRYLDLKRWMKLDYMDTDLNKDILSGGWVNFPAELPSELNGKNKGAISVVSIDGKVTVFDGANKSKMKGFFKHTSTTGRQPFLNITNVNPYLSPVGKTQIDDYTSKGFELKQTQGWPQN